MEVIFTQPLTLQFSGVERVVNGVVIQYRVLNSNRGGDGG